MNVHDLLLRINDVLPPSTAVPGDAIGLHIDSSRGVVERCLVTLDVTMDVVDEAQSRDCACIVAFHPLIYQPLSRIDRRNRVGAIVAGLVQSDIALVAVHTTFDTFPQGTNALLAERLGISVQNVLHPLSSDGTVGIGVVGSLATPLSDGEFAQRIATVCGSPVRWSPSPSGMVSRVALVGGSGMSFWDDVVASGADAYVTADVKYHGFMDSLGKAGIFDPGHYEMEQFVSEGLAQTLGALIPEVEFLVSSVLTNPVRYAVSTATFPMTNVRHNLENAHSLM
jgi:dinuclear metal center YbgI/SA1388 family protein